MKDWGWDNNGEKRSVIQFPFNKLTLTAEGRMNWKEGPVHVVEQVLKPEGISTVTKKGVISGPSPL